MEVFEGDSPGSVIAPTSGSSPEEEWKLLAPPWHTALIVALAACASLAGAHSVKRLLPLHAASNLPSYLSSIALEWILAALVYWGLYLRRTSLRIVLGEGRRGVREWFVDAGAALAFWITALMILSTVAFGLRAFHLHPENIRGTVSRLAPYSRAELMAWFVLSLSAGICEEFIFRGYLQLQFARISDRVWVGVIASALIFGFSHGYEGLSGMLLIVAFGALFSIFRLVRGNVRAGMMAHCWHDFLSGMMLSAIAHHKFSTLG